MPSTRIGKIGRLPKTIRDELGQRIENNQLGVHIVAWLNQQPAVQEILQELFDGRPINEQNLSDWKQGGHIDWLRQRESVTLAQLIVERSDALESAADGRSMADHFTKIMAMELTRLAEDLLNQETDLEKRWARLCKVHREFSRLRRDDHQSIRTSIQHQRWERQVEAEQAAADQKAAEQRRRDLISPIHARLGLRECAEKLGGTPVAWNLAALVQEVGYGLDLGHLGRDHWPLAKPRAHQPNSATPPGADPAQGPAPRESTGVNPPQG